MKKQYMIPEIQVVKIQPNVLSVTSPAGPDATNGSTNNPDDLLSRGFWDFGDDDEDEE